MRIIIVATTFIGLFDIIAAKLIIKTNLGINVFLLLLLFVLSELLLFILSLVRFIIVTGIIHLDRRIAIFIKFF